VGPALQDFGTRDFMITSAQTPTEHKLLKWENEGKVWPTFLDFRVQNFASSKVQKININKLSICERRKGETRILGLRGSKLREFEYPNINIIKLPNSKIGTNVGLALRGFRLQDLVTSKSKHQYIATPRMRKCKVD
jgi:hypothetical protein